MRIEDSVVAVTGGASGLGEAVARRCIDQGAAGVDMGRNIFQSDCPTGMIQAVGAVVHGGEKPDQAIKIYEDAKAAA